MKKWSTIFMSILLVVTVGCNANQQGSTSNTDFKIGMVTDTGGLNDEAFNETTWEGIQKAGSELHADVKALESKRDDDYNPNLSKFARENRDIVWAVGFKFEKVLPEIAKQFPNVKFGILDSDLGGNVPKNVTAVTFKDEEGSFLVGVVAGLTTKTNKVGFIGGISSPQIGKFEAGYMAGVKAANPKATIQSVYAESFTDATKGRSLAQNMYNSGVDIIFHAAGGVGKGLFDEVKTREKGKFWAIGVDTDQSRLAPGYILTSMLKEVDIAVYDISKKVKAGQFSGGQAMELGLKEKGVGIAHNTSENVSPDVMKRVEEFKQKIIKGEIKVPKTKAELSSS